MLWLLVFAVTATDDDQIYRKLSVFARVLHTIEKSYVVAPNEDKLIDGAIAGMVETLDPHCLYLPASLYQQLIRAHDQSGDVGLTLEPSDKGVTVSRLEPGGVAETAGLRVGDQIEEIAGLATAHVSAENLAFLLSGPPGSAVTLSIERANFIVPRRFTLMRAVHSPALLHSERHGQQLYVSLKSFSVDAGAELEQLLLQERAKRPGYHGVVLDLRDNPGGLIEQAVRVVDLFVDHGVIVSTEGRGGEVLDVYRARQKSWVETAPLAVLVNHGSASAAEIVAGAFQDLHRATIVGTPTYGKGSVQSVIELEDGSALRLTTALYYTPIHRSIQPEGIRPDVVVEPGKDGDAQLSAALKELGRR